MQRFKKIKLTQGKYALVDAEDFERLSQWKWYINHGYAVRNQYGQRHTQVKMHIAILGRKPGHEIDHVNGKRADNRKKNLRFSTRVQNQQNRPRNKNNTTGFKGVKAHWTGAKFSYQARLWDCGRYIHIGTFKTKLIAHRAYIKKAKEFHGEFARWK